MSVLLCSRRQTDQVKAALPSLTCQTLKSTLLRKWQLTIDITLVVDSKKISRHGATGEAKPSRAA